MIKLKNPAIAALSASEFRVETTGAIAGVRGTEFGIGADGVIRIRRGRVWSGSKGSVEDAASLLGPEIAQGSAEKSEHLATREILRPPCSL